MTDDAATLMAPVGDAATLMAPVADDYSREEAIESTPAGSGDDDDLQSRMMMLMMMMMEAKPTEEAMPSPVEDARPAEDPKPVNLSTERPFWPPVGTTWS